MLNIFKSSDPDWLDKSKYFYPKGVNEPELKSFIKFLLGMKEPTPDNSRLEIQNNLNSIPSENHDLLRYLALIGGIEQKPTLDDKPNRPPTSPRPTNPDNT